jgi:long-chain acyl-CoA synthetase
VAIPDTLQALRRGFEARGSLPALIGFGGHQAETWSFAELGDISGRVAMALARRGIGPGDGVALIASNSLRWIAGFWGIVAAGAVAVPLDAQNDDRELGRMIETGHCRLAFTTAAIAKRLRVIAPSCQTIILDDASESVAEEGWQHFLTGGNAALPHIAAADTAVIVFTSGTTGSPKAVPLTHRNLLANVLALAATKLVGPGDRALLPLPLYHAYPVTIGMITPLALGCTVVLPAGISGPELLAAMREGAATALVGVPRLYTALLDSVRRGIATLPWPVAALFRNILALALQAERHRLHWVGRLMLAPLRRKIAPRLRLLVSGGAAVPIEVEETLDALGWEMLTGYGLVETSSMLTFNPPGAAVPGSAGRPVPGMELRIANPDSDGVGDIETRGPSLFAGYRDDAAKSREAFTADGWFRTGDLGSIDAKGYLHITARKTETIVLADGKKLFPEEFEMVYATAPLVREIALLGVDGALVGLVVPDLAAARDAGAMRLAEALREGLTAKARALPSYARLSGFAIAHDALPRTQLGKIRRHLLPALYAAAQRHEPAAAQAELSVEDRSLVEAPARAAVWRWLQQKYADRTLGLDTILQLDLGIDSLGWVELTLALERDLGIALREAEIARIVTIRDLLREAGAARPSQGTAAAAAVWLAPLSIWQRSLRAIGEPIIRLAMRRVFLLKVEGLDCLPAEGPMLICPNHVSYLDPFAVAMALPRSLLRCSYWGGWSGVAFNTRWRRLFSRAARVLPVDPDRAAGSGLAAGRLALERGWNLVWFPEGARSVDGRLQRFLPGIGALVETGAVPIIPAYIKGSFAAWPVEKRWPRPHPITVRFGRPVLPNAISTEPPGRIRDEKIAAAVQAAVAALADGADRVFPVGQPKR